MGSLEVSKMILIVEDEENLGKTLTEYLDENSFSCTWVKSIAEARKTLNLKYDYIILDIGLPDGSGLELAREIFSINKQQRLLFLSAQNSPDVKLEGLELGADDYMTKPFRLKELLLRLNKMKPINFSSDKVQENIYRFGPITFYVDRYELVDSFGVKVDLAQRESEILKVLIEKKNSVVSRDEIIEKVWGEDSYPSNRTIDNYIVKFRKWVDTANEYAEIQNIRGVGYKFIEKGKK